MLKQRIVGALVIKNGIVVQSINFKRFLPVGSPRIAVEYLNRWGIDEIAILDIDATVENRDFRYKKLREYSMECHVPVAAGGGIKKLKDIENIITHGADKVIINSAFYDSPELLSEGASEFGVQCIIASIDAKEENGMWTAYSNGGRQNRNMSVFDAAKMAQDHGAGEILINSIDRDGSKKGFDLELIKKMMKSVNIPVIALGGAANPLHLREVLETGVSAAAAANMFHYTEHSVLLTKAEAVKTLKSVRYDSYVKYSGEQINGEGRLKKLSDETLRQLRFEIFEEEVI